MSILKVFSGDCCLCDVGMAVGAQDCEGRDLHTGDIVTIHSGEYLGTDAETWSLARPLTAVVADQYQSYSNGSITLRGESHSPFVMGIKTCGFNDPAWRVQIVKKFSDVVEGERWTSWGFNYAMSEKADAARDAGVAA